MNELNEIKEAMNDFKNAIDKHDKVINKVIERNNKIIAGLDDCSRIINEYLKNSKIKMKLFNFKYPDIELRLISRSIKFGNEYGFIDYDELQRLRKQNKKNKGER